MKARIKATGEIGVVANIDILFGCKGYRYQSDEVEIIDSYADIDIAKDPDYWTRLEHQYAGMAMQGLMSILPNIGGMEGRTPKDEIIDIAMETAHALVEKMKEERK
jgi:hypothetical protein